MNFPNRIISKDSIVDVLIYENKKYTVLSWKLHEKMHIGCGVLVPYKDKTIPGIFLKKTETTKENKTPIRKTLQNLGMQTSAQLLNILPILAEKNLTETADYYKLIVPNSYYNIKTSRNLQNSSKEATKNQAETRNTRQKTDQKETVDKTRIFNIIQPIEKNLLDETVKYINTTVKQGQVLVLLPSLSQIEKLYQKIPSVLRQKTIKLPQASHNETQTYINNITQIALGTRNNVLQYGTNIKTIIIVEENHVGHRYMSKPYITTRVIAKERLGVGGEKLYYISSNPSAGVLTRNVKTIETSYKGYNTKLIDLTELPYSERNDPKTILAEIKKIKTNKKTVKIGYYNTVSKRKTVLQNNLNASSIETKNQYSQTEYDIIVIDNIDKILEKPTLQPGSDARRHINTALNYLAQNGLAIIITTHKNHPILQSYAQKNHLLGLQWQHTQAKKYNLPPYGKIVILESKYKKNPPNLPHEFHGGLENGEKKMYAAVLTNTSYEKYKIQYKKSDKIAVKIF